MIGARGLFSYFFLLLFSEVLPESDRRMKKQKKKKTEHGSRTEIVTTLDAQTVSKARIYATDIISRLRYKQPSACVHLNGIYNNNT